MNGAVIPQARVPIYAPDGRPVSTAFPDWDTNASYDSSLRTALQAVDKVHGDGLWQQVRIRFDDAMKDDEIAGFQATRDGAYLFFNPKIESTVFEVIHEIGHGIEKFGFDSIGRYAMQTDTEFSQWRKAIQNSQAYQRLEAIKGQKEQIIMGVAGKKKLPVSHVTTHYLLYWHELWARSYAQYVGLTAGNLEMLREIASQSDSSIRQVAYPQQWAVNDYDDIGQAIEDLFVKRKWLK